MVPDAGIATPSTEVSDSSTEVSDLGALVGPLLDHHASLHVVLLEDDDVDARLLARMLDQAWPMEVEVTQYTYLADLEAGLADLEPDVVFCDLTVPDARGVEVVERAVRAAGAVPVVVLTGNSDPSVPILALESGAQDYLSKGSFDVELLARTLRYSMARSHADREVRRIAYDLNVANDELEQYAGIVAHDLRAPLRTGRLFADRLVATTRAGKDGEHLARALDASLERMEAMIGHLLQISTLREDSVTPMEEQLSAVVDDAVADLHVDLQAVEAVVAVDEDGPVRADPVLLRELLGNLIQNSLKYRSPERTPEVHLRTETIGLYTTVVVRDNGVGIEPEFRDRVFRLFERLDNDPEIGGLGFGLAFCRRIVELHGGSIRVGSPEDEIGLEVRIVLPYRV